MLSQKQWTLFQVIYGNLDLGSICLQTPCIWYWHFISVLDKTMTTKMKIKVCHI